MMLQPTLHSWDAGQKHVPRGHKCSAMVWLVIGVVGAIVAETPRSSMAQGSYSVLPVSSESVPTTLGQPTGRQVRVSIDVHDSTVKYVMQVLAKQAHLQIGGSADEPALLKRISVHIVNADIHNAFMVVLKGTGLRAEMDPTGSSIVIVNAAAVEKRIRSQTDTVTGRVTDSASGKGVSGATVSIKGTKLSTLTSESGEFVLRDVPVGTQLLTVKLFGYKPTSRAVSVVDSSRATVNFVLIPTATVLSGMVTTATGQEQRLRVGNDISVINVDSVMQVAPVTNVTQLLQDRVPGLVVQTTSGIPGAPSRLRLRGVSSISGNNDPIVIVDGVRIYADQSGSGTDGNIGNVAGAIVDAGGGSGIASSSISGSVPYAGPSALDQIDPNSIETIEVMKGPSASALYGSDAANGVIIITTKHGHVGPARWNASADLGWTALQGTWPVNYFRFGSPRGGGASRVCSPYVGSTCVLDSIITFQALNDPAFSPLGTGGRQDMSLGVSGGNGTLTYAFTGSAGNQTGYLHLPGAIAQSFATTHGFSAPDWMVHPQQYTTWGGMGRLDVQLGRSGVALSFSENLFHSHQQQSSLQNSIATLQSTYLTPANLATASFIDQYYEHVVLNTLTTTNTVTLKNWEPWSWLPITATVGINTANLDNSALLPHGYVLSSADSIGKYQLSRGTNQAATLNVGTSLLRKGVQVAIGLNVHTSSMQNTSAFTGTNGVPLGASIPTTFANGTGGYASQAVYNTATYGWYVQPTFSWRSRLFIRPGMRFDGGSASGSGNTMNIFPKTDISYLAVDRPTDPLFGVLTLVRPRIVFGISGVQPGPAEALRTFATGFTITPYDTTGAIGIPLPYIDVYGIGNTDLHPERSRELEGGVDLGFRHDRLTLKLTGYNKTRYDAIIAIPVAPSVVGTIDGADLGQIAKNIGTIRNSGFEASVGARLLDTRSVGWSINANWATDRNRVVSLLPGQLPIVDISHPGAKGMYETRVTPGYPLFGVWARPIVSYTDENSDGIIEPAEVRLADSSVYLGAPYPDYTVALSTTLTLLNGRLSINTAGDYSSGLTQVNGSADLIQTVVNDPNSPLAAQAAVALDAVRSSAFGRIQTVDALRWTTVSLNYILSPAVARWFRTSSMSVALQGSNLGLHTNYHGKDPSVNAFSTGNQMADTGQLPQPRTWSLRVTIGG